MIYVSKMLALLRANPARVAGFGILALAIVAVLFSANAILKQDSFVDPQALVLDGEWGFYNGKLSLTQVNKPTTWSQKIIVPQPIPENIRKNLAAEFWYQKEINLKNKWNIHGPAISLGSVKGEHEVYWNGKYIGSGGKVSLGYYRIPQELMNQETATLLVRLKKSDAPFPGIVHFRPVLFGRAIFLEKQIQEYYLQTGVKPLFSLCFKLFFFFAFLGFFLTVPQKREYFSFSLFALFSGLAALFQSRFIPGYESAVFKQTNSFFFTLLSLSMLPILTSDFLRFPEKHRSLTRILSFSVVITFLSSTFFLKDQKALFALFEISNAWLLRIALGLSLALSLYAYWNLKYTLKIKHRAFQVSLFALSLGLGGIIWSMQSGALTKYQLMLLPELLDLGIFLGLASSLTLDFRFASMQSQQSRKVVPKWFTGLLATGTQKAVMEIPLIVLAIDIASYTKNLMALDEQGRKDYHDRIRAALVILHAQFGAQKLSDRGDGGLFGWDLPESDLDKKIALHKISEALQALMVISQEQEDLKFRMGLASGSIRCEWREGEISYLGEALNIASRLETMAKPGSVLVDEDLSLFMQDDCMDEVHSEKLKGIVYKARSLKAS